VLLKPAMKAQRPDRSNPVADARAMMEQVMCARCWPVSLLSRWMRHTYSESPPPLVSFCRPSSCVLLFDSFALHTPDRAITSLLHRRSSRIRRSWTSYSSLNGGMWGLEQEYMARGEEREFARAAPRVPFRRALHPLVRDSALLRHAVQELAVRLGF
jgi:hypothetical protein